MSVGVPVRNGAATLDRALRSLVEQSHENLEIVISDNGSSDDTPRICCALAARDPRVRYFRQEPPILGVRNFRFVLEQSRGPYFLWAAHDDLRSENYLEVLLRGFARVPSASLVFSDNVHCSDVDLRRREPVTDFARDCDSIGLGFWQRLRKQCQRSALHVYGLIDRRALAGYGWYELTNSPDVPLLLWLLCRGDFVYEPGATFLYYDARKSLAESAREIAFAEPDRLAAERIAWVAAGAVRDAEALAGRRRSRLLAFVRIYVWRNRGVKNTLYRWTPEPARRLWRAVRAASGHTA